MTEPWRLANNSKLYRQRQKYKQILSEVQSKLLEEALRSRSGTTYEILIEEIKKKGVLIAQEKMKNYLKERGEI